MANVHKDFHGALSFGLTFLRKRYNEDGVREFLSGLSATVYKPLVEGIQTRGLAALRDHWQEVFALEDGEIELQESEEELVLRVHRCPAIAHMQENNYAIAEHYCEHTRIVNEAVCGAAGYESEVAYDQQKGCCVQKFRRLPQ